MGYVNFFAVLFISIVLLKYQLNAASTIKNDDEMKLKPVDALPKIVTKIVGRGLVPKRSLTENSMQIQESQTNNAPEPPKNITKKVRDDPRQLQCQLMDEEHITYDEFQCKKNNGEYLHSVELSDGTRHREEGIVLDGVFTIRGFFFSKEDPKYFHIYIKDKKGFHYYLVPVSNADGTQEYGIGDEDDEICSVRGDSCIDPKILASMLG